MNTIKKISDTIVGLTNFG